MRCSRVSPTCDHRSEPDPAEQARWYGPETTVPQWRERLVCARCGSRQVGYGGERGEAAIGPGRNTGVKAAEVAPASVGE
jgi:hypothetical protein